MIDNDFASILDRVRKNKYLLIDNLYDTLIQSVKIEYDDDKEEEEGRCERSAI